MILRYPYFDDDLKDGILQFDELYILGPFTTSDLVAPASNIPSTSRGIVSCKWFLENGKCSRRCRSITARQLVLLLAACTESLSRQTFLRRFYACVVCKMLMVSNLTISHYLKHSQFVI